MNEDNKTLLQSVPTTKITLLFLLATHGLGELVSAITPTEFIVALSYGNPSALEGNGMLYLFLGVLTVVFGWMMIFGYQAWTYQLAKNETPTTATLLSAFEITGKVISLTLLKALCTIFWIFVLSFPLTMLLMPLLSIPILSPLIFAYPLLVLVAMFWVYLRYLTAPYFLMENSNDACAFALHESAQLQGRAFKPLIQAHFQFLPWMILFIAMESAAIYFIDNPMRYLFTAFQWCILLKCYPLFYLSIAQIYQSHKEN